MIQSSPYVPNLSPMQLYQMLIMQQMQQQSQQQGSKPKPSWTSALTGKNVGNATNQLGRLFGQDWSTTAGNFGGGTEIGSSASSAKDLGMDLESLFGGGEASTVADTSNVASGVSEANVAAPTESGWLSNLGKPGSFGSYAGIASAGYDGYKGATDTKNLDPKERAERVRQAALRGVASYFTGGISEAAIKGTDALFGKGTVQKGFDAYDDVMSSDIMKLTPLGWMHKGTNLGIQKLLGDKTKDAEYRSLADAYKNGYITEKDFANRAGHAESIGSRGRKIDTDKDWKDRYEYHLKKGDSEELARSEADRFKKYGEFIKSGDDKSADAMLRGQDILGYGNIGKEYFLQNNKNLSSLPIEEQIKFAQGLIDRGAVKSGGGTLVVDEEKARKKEEMKPTVPSNGFEPSSEEYKKLSKADKDAYWILRNKGR